MHLWFAAWTATALLVMFAFLALASIGLLLLPIAVAALVWCAWRGPWWPDALGLACGFGITLVLVGFAAARSDAVSPDGFFVAGIAFVLVSFAAYLGARRLHRPL